MRGGYPCVAGSQVCATESVKCWAVPICTAPGDADEVEVAVGGPGVTRRGHGVSLLRHHEGGGGLGAVTDGAVALLLSDADLNKHHKMSPSDLLTLKEVNKELSTAGFSTKLMFQT